ncbi:MAG: sterol desaturase family protein [Planctomycetota bacterium]
MTEMLTRLANASVYETTCFFLKVNVLVFVGSVALCWLLGVVFGDRRLFDRWEPLRASELFAALVCVMLNVAVSVAGWALWQAGWITVLPPAGLGAIWDCFAMVIGMDLGMYVFHRIAHVAWVYRILHCFHHRHEVTNPLSLFVLHPLEVIGFGGLMIVFLIAYSMSLDGLLAYLGLNVLFGTLGHSGVEPFPTRWNQIPGLRLIGTSTFHAGHHATPSYNFGFYTLVWDKLFGTLDPGYYERFAAVSKPRRTDQ